MSTAANARSRPKARRKRVATPIAAQVATFNATLTDGPLWANGHPGIWIRWTAAHEAWVESDQAITYGNRSIGVEVVGRIVRCGDYGEWYVGDWRPMCATCRGSRQVLVDVREEPHRAAFVDALDDTVDAGLFYMVEALVACPDCRAHPGWVVG